MPVAEQDIERIGVFRRVASEEPPEGYEPILHIRIPVDVDISDLKERGIVGIHYNGKPEIIDKNTKINVDDKLMQFLSKPFTPQEKNWAYLRFDGAQLDCSARMLITYHKDLLDTMLTELDITRKRRAKLYLIYLIKLHDGNFHLKTLIDPREKTGDAVPYPSGLSLLGRNIGPLSVYWHELWAIVNEMKFLDGVNDEISEFVKKKVEGARKASGVRLYSMIYEIIRFFQNKGLTLDDMIEILKVPTEVDAAPESWLCHVLLDLAEGLDPIQIPYESSFYKVAGADYDTSAEKMEQFREILLSPRVRMEQSMYEVIMIGEEAIERKWFCLNPKELDIAEVLLKMLIYYQETFKMYGYLIPTTLHPTNFHWYEYQEIGLSIEDLFRRAMKRKISPEKLESLFNVYEYPTIKESVIREALIKTLVRMGFRDLDDFAKWLGKNKDEKSR